MINALLINYQQRNNTKPVLYDIDRTDYVLLELQLYIKVCDLWRSDYVVIGLNSIEAYIHYSFEEFIATKTKQKTFAEDTCKNDI